MVLRLEGVELIALCQISNSVRCRRVTELMAQDEDLDAL
jgi:hypothetical protein